MWRQLIRKAPNTDIVGIGEDQNGRLGGRAAQPNSVARKGYGVVFAGADAA
jgi:hypothetical protein